MSRFRICDSLIGLGLTVIVGIGDFGDGVQRLVLADNSKFEVAYELQDGVLLDEPLVTEQQWTTDLWIPLGPLDLQNGESVMLVQQGVWFDTEINAFGLDEDSTIWTPVGSPFEGLPQIIDTSILDANGDGLRDLVVWGVTDDPGIFVITSDGSGGFTVQSLGAPCTLGDAGVVYAHDLTEDGAIDLACTAGSTVKLIRNDGSGSFLGSEDFHTLANGHRFIGSADLVGDGTSDVLLTSISAGEHTFMVAPRPSSEPDIVTWPLAVSGTSGVEDFDGDGVDEVLMRMNGGIHVLRSRRL